MSVYALALADISMDWSAPGAPLAARFRAKAGDLLEVPHDRFREEFEGKEARLLFLDPDTYRELCAKRDEAIEKARQEAAEALQRAEDDRLAEEARQAHRRSLEALVVEAALASVED